MSSSFSHNPVNPNFQPDSAFEGRFTQLFVVCQPDYMDFVPGKIASPEAWNRVVSVELHLRTKAGTSFWGRLLSRARSR